MDKKRETAMSAPAEKTRDASTNEFDITTLRVQRSAPSPEMKKKKKDKPYLLLVAAVAVALAGWFLYPHAVPVETTSVTMVYPSQQYTLINATGYVVPQLKAAVASKATGRLEWLGVAEGSHVKKGEVIARLDDRDVEAAYDSAVAQVEVARAGVEAAYVDFKNANQALERATAMYKRGFMSKAAVDDATARQRMANTSVTKARASLDAAQANASNAEIAVDYTQIRAPFDGVILSKAANIGDIVTPMSSAADSKGAVVTMADMSTLEVEADVSESGLAQIKVNQPCTIMLDSIPGLQFRGVVSRIVPTIDRAKATVTTKVRFVDTDPRILPDMSAKVSFLSQAVGAQQRTAVMAVNPKAITERDGKKVVFAVNDGQARRVDIAVGKTIGDLAAITGKLKSGDEVVLAPPSRLGDGRKVKLAKSI